MNLTTNQTTHQTANQPPAGLDAFNKDFALRVALPLAEAAYAVMQKPGETPALPEGYRMTALMKAHPDALAAVSGRNGATAAKLAGNSDILGLIGNNLAAKTAFVSFRGTQDLADWAHDLDAIYEPYGFAAGAGDVHAGFLEVYRRLRDSIGANLAAACAGCERLFVTGHSMGAAVAVLSAPDLKANFGIGLTPDLITFAGPRSGLLRFHHFFNQQIPECYRVVASHDVVPQVPLCVPPGFLYEHVGMEVAVEGGQIDPVKAHSLELSYRVGVEKLYS